MTYVTDQDSAELRAHMRRLQKMAGWHNPLDDRLFKEIEALDAEVAALRADAARYQWLSRFYVPAGDRDEDEWDEMDTAVLIGGRVLNDAIDARLSKAGGQPSCLREGEA